tara:strand:+ start:157 stop:1671 length:1515 start_codon:yes stop_codon:yes gene_type:complete
MELENHILAVVEPAILPTEIKMDALAEEGGDNVDKQSKQVGAFEPFIMCNGVQFTSNTIESLDLELNGKVPKCTVAFNDEHGAFKVDSMPRDGDFFTVLLNSKHQETFKSVHMDFDIIEITTDADSPNSPGGGLITLRGVCKIPRLYAEDCQVLDADTSLNHLETVVRDLEIGLATNVDSTDDSQARIQAYETYLDFIKGIVDDSYISDDAFVKFYIDQYYYLNFVDINKIFNSPSPKLDEVMTVLTGFAESEAKKGGTEDSTDSDNVEVPLILTNHNDLSGLSCFVNTFELINNSSKVSLKAGYARTAQIYDNNSDTGDRFQEFTIEPLVTEELSELDEPLRGNRKDERYKDMVKYKYMGRQNAGDDGLGNTHANAIFTKLHDRQNNMEIEKMKLKVEVIGFNPSIYKFCKIPVVIYHYDGVKIEAEQKADQKREDAGLTERPLGAGKPEGDANDFSQMMDKFISGYYIVENIDYRYDQENAVTTELTLIRREWPSRSGNLAE